MTVTGTAVAGSTVTVFDGTTKLGTATVGSNGAWNYTTAALTDGKHSLTATDTVSGKTSVASSAATLTIDTHAPTTPVLVSDSVVNTNHVLVSGTAEANSSITVYDGTAAVGTAMAGSNGAWSFTTGALTTGSHVLTATATDAAGNTSGHSAGLDPVIGSPTSTVWIDWHCPGRQQLFPRQLRPRAEISRRRRGNRPVRGLDSNQLSPGRWRRLRCCVEKLKRPVHLLGYG